MKSDATKQYSNIQERRVAEALGWERVVASGARDFHPGDVRSDLWLGECKTHTSQEHKIFFSQDVWNKLSAEALSQFRFPVMFVDDGSQRLDRTWVLLESKHLPDVKYDCDYPSTIRKNIVFDHFDIVDYIKSFNNSYLGILHVGFNDSDFTLMSFQIFEDIVKKE